MKALANHLVSAAFFLSLAGCCCGFADLGALFQGEDAEPSADTPGVDLGVGVFPDKTSESAATRYSWRDRRLEPDVYRAGYALGAEEQKAVNDAHWKLAEKVNFKDQGDGHFRWTPPSGCGPHMQCIFEELASRSKPDLEPLAARFRARVDEAKLDPSDAAQLVTSFVQAIPYQIPEKLPFGLLPPALVAARKTGDCDSKALLLHMLLASLGIDSVLLTSDAHRHSMLAVAVPVSGDKIVHQGRSYAWVEVTAKNAPIGWISKDLLKPNDWVVVPVRVRDPEGPAQGGTATGKADDEPSKKPRKKR
jgi:hypothetical protein